VCSAPPSAGLLVLLRTWDRPLGSPPCCLLPLRTKAKVLGDAPDACQGKPCPCALAARAQGALLQRPTCYCLAQQQAHKGLPPSLRQKPTREQTKEKQTETTRDWEMNQN